MEKNLFIPLCRAPFDAFLRGEKNIEYRLNGKRWNDRTCVIGRHVTLSLGYSGARLYGVITEFNLIDPRSAPDLHLYYGDVFDKKIAAISIRLDQTSALPIHL